MKTGIVIAGLLSSLLPAVASAAEGVPGGAPPGNAERGRQQYVFHLCHTCHGTVGQGGERGAGPRIAPGVWPYAAFAQQTRKPRQVMIPYSEKTLPEQDLVDIYHYLLTVKPAPDANTIPLLKGL